ncbi:MAG: HAD family phosphatase [Christensenellaceae bacterium]|nr:HAD family phosphatase [Christensenellaceae bacterium]
MRIDAIAFDLDDTLLRDDRTISPYTLSVLRRAAEKGIRIIPASGRTRDSMRGFVEKIGCATCSISCNGAEVWSPAGESLMRELLDVPLAVEIARFAEARGCYAQTYAEDCFFYNQEGKWADAYAESSELRGVYVGNLEAYIAQPTPKILIMDTPARIAELLREAQALFEGRVSLTCSKPYFLEVNPLRATKGNALRWCADRFGFAMEHAAAFGDSLNDLSMLTAAGHGIAVANAREDVRAQVATVCGSNQEDGLAHYIEQYVLSGGNA